MRGILWEISSIVAGRSVLCCLSWSPSEGLRTQLYPTRVCCENYRLGTAWRSQKSAATNCKSKFVTISVVSEKKNTGDNFTWWCFSHKPSGEQLVLTNESPKDQQCLLPFRQCYYAAWKLSYRCQHFARNAKCVSVLNRKGVVPQKRMNSKEPLWKGLREIFCLRFWSER